MTSGVPNVDAASAIAADHRRMTTETHPARCRTLRNDPGRPSFSCSPVASKPFPARAAPAQAHHQDVVGCSNRSAGPSDIPNGHHSREGDAIGANEIKVYRFCMQICSRPRVGQSVEKSCVVEVSGSKRPPSDRVEGALAVQEHQRGRPEPPPVARGGRARSGARTDGAPEEPSVRKG